MVVPLMSRSTSWSGSVSAPKWAIPETSSVVRGCCRVHRPQAGLTVEDIHQRSIAHHLRLSVGTQSNVRGDVSLCSRALYA
jgi:hypothetical protein